MRENESRFRLETKALVIGYAMSRLDTDYLAERKVDSWKAAFEEAANTLSIKATSARLLRDEFDPFHPNRRKGWHKRKALPSRQRILDELGAVSHDGLIEIVSRILSGDDTTIVEAIDSLADVSRTSHNVAERLLTGRKAEDYFLRHCERLIEVAPDQLIDARLLARGYDFGVHGVPERAIEVKGLKSQQGDLLFTDREWSEAKVRGSAYWLVVIANLRSRPKAHVIPNPRTVLKCESDYRTSITVSWRARFSGI